MTRSPISAYFVKTPVTLIVGSLLIILCAAFLSQQLHNKLVVQPWMTAITDKATQEAQTQEAKINTFFTALSKQLKQLANNTALFHALQAHDDAKIAQLKKMLAEQLPEMAKISFIATDRDDLKGTKNFAGVARTASSIEGKQLSPTAVKLDSWQIINTVSITQGSDIVGRLVASLPASSLQSLLLNTTGKTELLQYTPGLAPQIIVSAGHADTPYQALIPVSGRTDWKIRHSLSASGLNTVKKPTAIFTTGLIGIVTTAIVLIFLLARHEVKKSRALHTLNDDDLNPQERDHFLKEKLAQHCLPPKPTKASPKNKEPLAEVFRKYDIRGNATHQITEGFALRLGKSIGTDLIDAGQLSLFVGADGRSSSPLLKEALIQGLLSTGCTVIDIGLVPTPLLNFALQCFDEADCGVMVTASHNPASDNGFKIFYNQQGISDTEILALKSRMDQGDWKKGQGKRQTLSHSLSDFYTSAVVKNVALGPQKPHVIIDCANGASGPLAPALLETLGCTVTPLYCDIDGTFPNHSPDPSNPANLKSLINAVRTQGADLGLALDGDGDRLVAVTSKGAIIWPDELLMIFAQDVLSQQPDTHIVFDIKSTRRLESLIRRCNGHPVMCKTGHSNIRQKITERHAPLGGEFSGHIFFNDRWFGFDDGLYAAARLIEIISQHEQSLHQIIDGFEPMVFTPELRVHVADDEKFAIVALISSGAFPGAKRITIDGLRLEYPDGWALVRASNTSPYLTLRFEADNPQALLKLQNTLKEHMVKILPDAVLPF